MIVAEYMTIAPATVNPSDTLAAARSLMDTKGVRHLLVVDNTGLVGVLTAGDIRKHEGYLERSRVTAAMSPYPIVVRSDTPMREATSLLIEKKIRSLPVVDDGKVVGIITTTDLLRAMLKLIEERT